MMMTLVTIVSAHSKKWHVSLDLHQTLRTRTTTMTQRMNMIGLTELIQRLRMMTRTKEGNWEVEKVEWDTAEVEEVEAESDLILSQCKRWMTSTSRMVWASTSASSYQRPNILLLTLPKTDLAFRYWQAMIQLLNPELWSWTESTRLEESNSHGCQMNLALVDPQTPQIPSQQKFCVTSKTWLMVVLISYLSTRVTRVTQSSRFHTNLDALRWMTGDHSGLWGYLSHCSLSS